MTRRVLFVVLLLGALSVITLAVGVGSRPKPLRAFTTEHNVIQASTVVTGLSHPWSLAFLPDGDMLVTERDGRLRRIHDGALQRRSISGTPRVRSSSQEGLLDVALHPQFAQPGANGTTIALARGRLDGDALQDIRDIFVADNWSTADGNIGSRVAFMRDGTLLMTTGDRHMQTPAQDPTRHWGKILRLRATALCRRTIRLSTARVTGRKSFRLVIETRRASRFTRRRARSTRRSTDRLAATS